MLMAFISWWYGKGWAWKADQILSGIERSIDTFSLGLLIKTWFSPFRQIDAIKFQNVSFDIRVRRFFDRLISRIVGAFLRTILMVIGIFYITVKSLYGLLILLIWPFIPILPIIFIVFFTTNITPEIVPKIRKNINSFRQQKNTSRGNLR